MDERAAQGLGGGLRALLEGDPEAVGRVAALVKRIVGSRGYGIPAGERPDLVQEAMLQLWRALTAPAAAQVGNPEGLAATIAHRCCLGWMRRRRTTAELPSDLQDAGPSSEEDLLRAERRRIGLRLVGALSEGCRQVLRLRLLERLTYREIGQRLQRSEHGLRTQVSDCLREARARLEAMRRDAAPRPPPAGPRATDGSAGGHGPARPGRGGSNGT